jgi:hypothetical protein
MDNRQGVTDWRKASYSNGGGTACVEVGTQSGLVAVRDTKTNGHGLVLTVTPKAWKRFTAHLR